MTLGTKSTGLRLPMWSSSWMFPFPCEVVGALLVVGFDAVNWQFIGRWAVHAAYVYPLS